MIVDGPDVAPPGGGNDSGTARPLRRALALAGAATRRPTAPGRLRPLLGLAMFYLAAGTLLRLALHALYGPPAAVPWSDLPAILVGGAVNDAVVAVYLSLPLHLYLAIVPERLFRNRVQRALLAAASTGLVFLIL